MTFLKSEEGLDLVWQAEEEQEEGQRVVSISLPMPFDLLSWRRSGVGIIVVLAGLCAVLW